MSLAATILHENDCALPMDESNGKLMVGRRAKTELTSEKEGRLN